MMEASMQKLVMYGKSTRRKSFLLRDLSSLLAMEHTVWLVTEDYWWIDGLKQMRLHEGLDIIHPSVVKEEEATVDYMLVDRQTYDSSGADQIFLFSSLYKEEVINNEALFKSIEKVNGVIYQELLYDTNIHVKYLNARYGIDPKKVAIYTHYLYEPDLALQIECDYNEKMAIKYFSKGYRKLVEELLGAIDGIEKKKVKKWLRQLMKEQKRKGGR